MLAYRGSHRDAWEAAQGTGSPYDAIIGEFTIPDGSRSVRPCRLRAARAGEKTSLTAQHEHDILAPSNGYTMSRQAHDGRAGTSLPCRAGTARFGNDSTQDASYS